MVKWYGNVDDTVAHLPGTRHALKRAATEIGELAKMDLSTHRTPKDKRPPSRIKVHRGKLDWYVTLIVPGDERAAAAVELGHDAPNGKYVKGLYILSRAAGLV